MKKTENVHENRTMKRSYSSQNREAKAAQTRCYILSCAKSLFESTSIEEVTIEQIARKAKVSVPTIYALFQSKRGIVREIIDQAIPPSHYEVLITRVNEAKTVRDILMVAAKIARTMYDAERVQMDLFWKMSLSTPEFQDLEKEREKRRYQRQEDSLRRTWNEQEVKPGLAFSQARDVLWVLTGRDMYRLLVVEKEWSADAYEQWLAQSLIDMLILGSVQK